MYLRYSVPQPSLFERRAVLPKRPQTVWCIRRGVVRTLAYLDSGTIVTLGIWSAGDYVGLPLIQHHPDVVDWEALTTVEAHALPCWSAEDVSLRYWQQAEALMLVRSHPRAEGVLWAALQWLAQRFGRIHDQGVMIPFRLSHQDLADLGGLTRVTVTRLLKAFQLEGRISRHSHYLVIHHTCNEKSQN